MAIEERMYVYEWMPLSELKCSCRNGLTICIFKYNFFCEYFLTSHYHRQDKYYTLRKMCVPVLLVLDNIPSRHSHRCHALLRVKFICRGLETEERVPILELFVVPSSFRGRDVFSVFIVKCIL